MGVWLKMDHRCHSFNYFSYLFFKNWGCLPSRLFCWRCLLTYFSSQIYTLFLSGGLLGLIEHSLVLNRHGFLWGNQFSLHQKYIWVILNISRKEMTSLGLSFRVFCLNNWTTIVMLKNFLYSVKPTNIEVDSFKKWLYIIHYFFLKSVFMLTQCYDCNLVFVGIQLKTYGHTVKKNCGY